MSDSGGMLLSELENAHPSDNDLVASILSDLNQPSASNPVSSMPPPAGARMPMQQAPPPPQVYPHAADPAVPTAHMIGRDHPTQADFQRMMMNAQSPMPFNAMVPQMQAPVMQVPQQVQQVLEPAQKNWQGKWVDELKQPLLVAIIVFLVTLPAVNLLVAHYAPQLLTNGGDFTLTGKVGRALVGGGLFWVFQRVIAPLLSL